MDAQSLCSFDNIDYHYYEDDNGLHAVNQHTGEVTDAHLAVLPSGSSVLTPEDKQARAEYQTHAEKRRMIKEANKHGQRFMFVNTASPFDNLPPATAARLVVLCTYASYDGRLLHNTRTQMRRADIQTILGLSKSAAFDFWNSVSPKYIIDDGDGLCLSNKQFFLRGHIPKRQHDTWLKFYINAVRALYRATEKPNIKHIGYVFKLLPFVNIEHNVLCWNVLEKDIDLLEPLTIGDVCDLIGYDRKNLYRLLKTFKKLHFKMEGHAVPFIRFVNNGIDIAESLVVINPDVLYSGTNADAVRNLGLLCSKS